MSTRRQPWVTAPLVDVLDFREGPGIMAKDFRKSGVPLLRLAGLKRGAPLLAGCNYLDPAMVARRWDHFRVREGDVLLSTSALLGEVAVVDKTAVGAVPYTGIIAFRSRDSRLDQSFVRHALSAPSFIRQIEAMGAGSVLRHFGPMHLRQMTIDLPPIPEQRAIAEVLDALDDKAEVNRTTALAAEELALNIANSVSVAATVGSLAVIHRRPVSMASIAGQDVEYFRLPAFDAARLPIVEGADNIKSGKFLIERPTVLVSKLNPHIPRVWMAVPGRAMPAVTSTEFIGLHPREDYPIEALWAGCASATACAQLNEMVRGTTGSHQRIAPEDLLRVEIADPRSLDPVQSSTLVEAVRLAAALRVETNRLACVRDAIRPRLLSGDTHVRPDEGMRRATGT